MFARRLCRCTKPSTLSDSVASLSTSAARAHRSQRTVFAACPSHNTKGSLSVMKIPASQSRYPAMSPRPEMEDAQQATGAHDLLQGSHSYVAVAGHSAGDGSAFLQRTPSGGTSARPSPAGILGTLKKHRAHVLLLGGMSGMASVVLFNGVTSSEIFVTAQMAKNMLMNVPLTALCSGTGDVVAQMMTGTRLQSIDWRRVVAAGSIGGILQGFGTTAWVWHLNESIPRSIIGLESLSEQAMLAWKVGIDSAFWGTVINTLNITLRRVAAGDSLVQAYHNWHTKIMDVTKGEFKFWPAFGSAVYLFVPDAQQVNVFGFGGLIWSIYLSFMANHGVASNAKGLFRYGARRPSGVRTRPAPAPAMTHQDIAARLVPARHGETSFAAAVRVRGLQVAMGRPRPSRVVSRVTSGSKLRV